MLVKIPVLRYHKSILDILWNLVKSQIIGVVIPLELCQYFPPGIINKACLRGFKCLLGGRLHHFSRL